MPIRHAISNLQLLTLPGLTSYAAGLQLQQQVYEAVKAGTCPDTLIQLQVTSCVIVNLHGSSHAPCTAHACLHAGQAWCHGRRAPQRGRASCPGRGCVHSWARWPSHIPRTGPGLLTTSLYHGIQIAPPNNTGRCVPHRRPANARTGCTGICASTRGCHGGHAGLHGRCCSGTETGCCCCWCISCTVLCRARLQGRQACGWESERLVP